jgi:hypothetical protein
MSQSTASLLEWRQLYFIAACWRLNFTEVWGIFAPDQYGGGLAPLACLAARRSLLSAIGFLKLFDIGIWVNSLVPVLLVATLIQLIVVLFIELTPVQTFTV